MKVILKICTKNISLQKKSEVIIWRDGRSKSAAVPLKRKGSSVSTSKKKARMSSNEANASALDEVDEVYQQLSDKHVDKFDADRLRMWAHLINMGKHTSLDTPPDYPFFRKRTARPTDSSSAVGLGASRAITAVNTAPGACISPAKRSNLRSQYMMQMKE